MVCPKFNSYVFNLKRWALYSLYLGQRHRTKAYGIKVRCYWELFVLNPKPKSSRTSITFFNIGTLELDPKPLDTLIVFQGKVIRNVKKGPIQGSICFKLVLALLILGPLSTKALRLGFEKISKYEMKHIQEDTYVGTC